jgi:hypothetical protein
MKLDLRVGPSKAAIIGGFQVEFESGTLVSMATE